MTGFRFRSLDDNEGVEVGVHGHRHGEPHWQEVSFDGVVIGSLHKVTVHYIGATYIRWTTHLGGTFYTRREAAEHLLKEAD